MRVTENVMNLLLSNAVIDGCSSSDFLVGAFIKKRVDYSHGFSSVFFLVGASLKKRVDYSHGFSSVFF